MHSRTKQGGGDRSWLLSYQVPTYSTSTRYTTCARWAETRESPRNMTRLYFAVKAQQILPSPANGQASDNKNEHTHSVEDTAIIFSISQSFSVFHARYCSWENTPSHTCCSTFLFARVLSRCPSPRSPFQQLRLPWREENPAKTAREKAHEHVKAGLVVVGVEGGSGGEGGTRDLREDMRKDLPGRDMARVEMTT